MSVRTDYRHTLFASYIGYITQAIVNNFAPLLFVTFHSAYGISLGKIGLLSTLNFGTQLVVDLLSAKFADKIGYRRGIVAAHVLAAAGMLGMGFLPELFPNPYIGICAALMISAMGSGLTEVLISPIVEACPTEGKAAAMSLLHSFYCWGSVLVIFVSTLLFRLLGMEAWRLISCLWAVIPLINSFYFALVPLAPLVKEGEGMSIPQLLKTRLFWLFALLMLCAGAAELSMSQWASAFAESGLHVSKAVGDLAGPCFFAVLMGLARILHSKIGEKVEIVKYLCICGAVCLISYLMAALSPNSASALLGCGLCGFAVGAMWPATLSLASAKCPAGGTAMFALLAMAGDCGCSAGPTLVGFVSGAAGNSLNAGLLSAAVFPAVLTAVLVAAIVVQRKRRE